MPFDMKVDAADTLADRAQKTVLAIDRLMEFFDGGRRWLRDDWESDDGRACLVTALERVRLAHGISGDRTECYIREAASLPDASEETLTALNDRCGSYASLLLYLRAARLLADVGALVFDDSEIARFKAEQGRLLA